ncbi:MAG: signal recognition particle-docking protein FtsY [Treponema sp.]|nr:signal recognition particle-docking protein FtsY [Treponema sp.]
MNFGQKIKSFFSKSASLGDDFFDDLADLLVEGDIGPKEAYSITGLLQEKCKKEKIAISEDARNLLAQLLENAIVNNCAGRDAPRIFTGNEGRLTIILMLGVNGVGKTTTAAKLAAMYMESSDGKNIGKKPILAAADTFRAAAIDQLKIHGQRLGIRVVAHKQGGDPAAVVYDAIEAAGSEGLVIADTAGRMHTKSALVEELRKIDRVVELKAKDAEYVKYLVLDATTGRNALAQGEIFCEAVSPKAAILTKYDSTAKGGVVFSLASVLHLPVAYLCTGEKYMDIQVFNPNLFAKEFAGLV